jgi:hypothetical protein
MTKRKLLKETITDAVLDQLSSPKVTSEKAMKIWWFTQPSSTNLRLTPQGDQALRDAEIEFFDLPISIDPSSWYSFITQCGKKLKCPYYIGVNKVENEKKSPFIRLYDSKIAVVMTLYGDIHSYLDSIKERQ